jgi:RNA polymerase sigma-70 factor, ECF subfamily
LALVRRAQRGDLAAQRELIVAYQRRVAGFVYAVTNRNQDIEDLCQRILIRMLGGLASLREATQFEAWLFRIARRVCIDEIRRRKVRPVLMPLLAEHTEVAEQPTSVGSEELDALRYALAQLNEKDRVLLALLQEGRSCREISAVLRLNVTAVKARTHRARLRLRAHYESRVA